jgi:hypothetical protein
MTTKKKPAPAPEPDPKRRLRLRVEDYVGKTLEQVEAASAQSPIHANAATALTFSRGTFGESGLTETVDALRAKVEKVKAGDLSGLEALLTAQATALDSIFTEMARRAALNMGTYIDPAEVYMRLAFKAQSQCRATVETLAEIKTPRHVSFVKQANIAHGPQQVNNGMQSGDLHAQGDNSIQSNELSGASNELLPDARASQAESRIDTPVEAVAEINRAAN